MESAGDNYLTTEVTSAPPQRLQLMLIEGALRFGLKAQAHFERDELNEASEAILRSQEIVAHLLAALRPEQEPALVQRVSAIYSFVFRSLVTAYLKRDVAKLGDALKVLQEERQTWKEVCQKMEGSPSPAASFDSNQHEAPMPAATETPTKTQSTQTESKSLPVQLDMDISQMGSSLNFEA